ncbi:glycine betaine ABC transporter substrate-binding protein [Tumebacillus flagellatus]|uniref:Glycine/betaine ABC transporter substrate-binding protein n=1 Tax=Tumebacillus flagellatus TaxID=1157490 RepID=A0A074LVV1_9BACL|nr:glycine betaine ABC transporter substrate-binding protein [Tumebacillus flagellatus]KEO84153.1 glycine/betaine ABC transporter substrate-binding protein [Tumebacillus flagellatus]
MKKRTRNVLTAGILTLALAGLTAGCSIGTSKSADEITVVGKNFTEQDIMANLVSEMLEKNTDLKVKTKSYLGGTDVCFSAMKNGSADVYVEYTGTGLVNIMGETVMSDPDAVYQKVKDEFPGKYKIDWLSPIGFNNTYAIAVTQETAQKYNLKTVSDLKAHQGEIVFGTEQEFLDRDDGLKGMKKTYALNFKDVKAMDPGLKYQALTSGDVQAIDAFTTDGRLAKNNLVLLEDDQHFFPPYYAAPIVRSEVLKQHPEVGEVLNKLAGKIDEKQMAELNAAVDVDKKKASDVAARWLEEQGLVKK